MENIYFLDWMYEEYNMPANILLNQCYSVNCGWGNKTIEEFLELISKANTEEDKIGLSNICDALFDWTKWTQKFKNTPLEDISNIHTKWKKVVNSNRERAKFSKQEIHTLEQFDFSFDLKFE